MCIIFISYKDRSISSKLKSFTVMGGNIYSLGNADTYLSEFNFYADPDAAYIVLERLLPKVILVKVES
jgi:inosine-uridine nucleoside N-ribohydrolase